MECWECERAESEWIKEKERGKKKIERERKREKGAGEGGGGGVISVCEPELRLVQKLVCVFF